MTETETPRMALAEIALMRAIVHWRRANDIEYVPLFSRYCGEDNRTVAWTALGAQLAPRVGVTPNYHRALLVWYPVTTVTETVDMLVALGYLPARFSTAYRAGWDASAVWHDTDEAHGGDEFRRLFHDPANVSFPAHGESA